MDNTNNVEKAQTKKGEEGEQEAGIADSLHGGIGYIKVCLNHRLESRLRDNQLIKHL